MLEILFILCLLALIALFFSPFELMIEEEKD
jgi:hypothetical protein